MQKLLEKTLILLQLGWRNIWRQKKRSWIVISSAVVGILGILFAMAFLNGFLGSMLDSSIESGLGHAQVRPAGYSAERKSKMILKNPGEILQQIRQGENLTFSYSPRFEREGFVRMGTEMRGVQVMGVDPEMEKRVSRFDQWLIEGNYLSPKPSGLLKPCLIGKVNAQKFEVKVGDALVISIGDKEGNTSSVRAVVEGIFQSPVETIDKYTVLMKREDLSRMYGNKTDLISYIPFLAGSIEKTQSLKTRLKSVLKGTEAEVLTYRELQPSLTKMLDMSEQYIYIFYVILMLGFALILFDTIQISVMERTFEIGIMRAVGSSASFIFWMVLFESLLLAFFGCLLGLGIGSGITAVLESKGISLQYFSRGLEKMGGAASTVYPYLTTQNLLTGFLLGLGAALVAGVYPSIRALKIKPVKALEEKR
jgi:ABC-type lipoprotein release transport system permease subunit